VSHRYILSRTWNVQKRGCVNFIMLNPSTADDVFDDATIRRCVGFAKRWGFSGLVVTNLFAFRATDPKDLERMAAVDPVRAIGEENDDTIQRCARHADAIVCAWGNGGSLHGRDLKVASSLLDEYDLRCIRKSKLGMPVHPVREAYTDAPIMFMYKRNMVPECA
jgi:hypothetical protein